MSPMVSAALLLLPLLPGPCVTLQPHPDPIHLQESVEQGQAGNSSFGCDPLHPSSENVMLACNGVSNVTHCHGVGGDGGRVAPGTRIQYACKEFYTPLGHEGNGGGGGDAGRRELTCTNMGQWSGLSRFNSFFCVEECGHRKINPRPLVIHGVRTERVSWPWHATIFRRRTLRYANGTSSTTWHYICGGSIVRNSVVLTAAHCVTTTSGEGLPPSEFRVALGAQTSDWSQVNADPTAQVYPLRRLYYIYESYDPRKHYQADIAILHLEPGMQFGDYVAPVCLPRDTVLEVDALRAGRTGQVAGFGVDETGNVSLRLKYGELLVKSRSECFYSLETKLSETQFCAGTQEGDGKWVSVCNGDSGGALVFSAPSHEQYFVYGVVSFANPGDTGAKEPCQNNAVFTRVLSFMTWVRTVLETIQGAVLRELAPNVEIPYVQSGPTLGLGNRVKMGVWPRELDTRLTSIHLNKILINSEEFLNVLERTRLLHTVNLTDVLVVGRPFSRRLRLPLLHTVIIDLAQEIWAGSRELAQALKQNSPGNSELVKAFLLGALFFNTEYEKEWRLEEMATLGLRVEVTYNYVKLLTVNPAADQGRLVLNTFPQTDAVLGNLPSAMDGGFRLRHLALNYCRVNLSLVDGRSLESLVLHDIEFNGGVKGGAAADQLQLADLVSTASLLKELVVGLRVNDASKMDVRMTPALSLSHLPPTLRHLAVTNVDVNATLYENERADDQFRLGGGQRRSPAPQHNAPYDERIVFRNKRAVDTSPLGGSEGHSDSEPSSGRVFRNLSTFLCDNCKMDAAMQASLPHHFPHLQTLILKTRQNFTGVQRPLESYANTFPRLTRLICIEHETRRGWLGAGSTLGGPGVSLEKQVDVGNGQHKWQRISNGYTIGEHVVILEWHPIDGGGAKNSVRHGEWRRFPPGTPLSTQFLYDANKLDHFYRAWVDFDNGERHSLHELRAMNSGIFAFKGDVEENFRPTKWPEIRSVVQRSLRAMHVSLVEVAPAALFASLQRAVGLRELVLTKLYLSGPITRQANLALLQDARLHYDGVTEEIPDFFDGLQEQHLRQMIPFQMTRLSGSRQKEQQEGNNATHVNSNANLRSFSLEWSNHIVLSWTRDQGQCTQLILNNVLGADGLLVEVEEEPAGHKMETLVICSCPLSPERIPDTVKFLYLRRVVMSFDGGFSRRLAQLPALTHLRVFEPTNADEPNRRNYDDLLHVSLSHLNPDTLEDFGVSRVHVGLDSEELPVFGGVRTLTVDASTLDGRVADNMWTIFPNVTRLTLLLPASKVGFTRTPLFLPDSDYSVNVLTLPLKVSDYEAYVAQYERLLLSALRNDRIEFIQATYVQEWSNLTEESPQQQQRRQLVQLLPEATVLPAITDYGSTFEFAVSRTRPLTASSEGRVAGGGVEWERLGMNGGFHSLAYWYLGTGTQPRHSCYRTNL